MVLARDASRCESDRRIRLRDSRGMVPTHLSGLSGQDTV